MNGNTHTYESYLGLCLDRLYSKLNPMQREAVCSVNGPLLVLAGAGSGKTTVLVNRIYNLINFGDITSSVCRDEAEAAARCERMRSALNGTKDELVSCLRSAAVRPASPGRVLCITFTNKAADEFKNRLSAMLGDTASGIWAGTFHSICVRILRRNIGAVGFSNSFTIYDTDDKKKLITQVMKELKIDDKVLPVKAVMNAVSGFKESRVLPDEAVLEAKDVRAKLLADIYSEYQQRLKKASALDFDDIILFTLILFEENPDILEYYQNKFDYILVDEYQDTNPSQNSLVLMLAGKKHNVCVVGDDDQSIYSFRGATVENILNFDKAFPEARTIKLEQNYRSTKRILAAANAVIANNVGRKGKNLWTGGDEGKPITARCLYTQAEEADYICGEIMKLHAFGTPLKDIAVLYRVNAISNALETAFVKNRLPYKIFGGIRYYERKEIKDIVAYLSVISNPADNTRLRRIINVPRRSIGDTTVDTVAELAGRDGLTMMDVVNRAGMYPELSRSQIKLAAFRDLIAELTAYSKEHGVAELISEVITRTGYDTALIEEGERDKADLVREFASSGLLYEQSSEEPSLEGFLADIALVSDTDDYDDSVESVSLMTVHSAKGLEFSYVFIAGFEEGVFPSMMAVQEGNTEEERRLAYVAITRAKEKLYITYTQARTLYGYTSQSRPSTFFEEIPKDLLDAEEPKKRPVYGNQSHGNEGRTGGGVRLQYGSREHMHTAEKPYGISAGTEKKPQSKPAPSYNYRAGDTVKHKFFGTGTVLSVEPMGTDALVTVEFGGGTVKKLMASFAKLEKTN